MQWCFLICFWDEDVNIEPDGDEYDEVEKKFGYEEEIDDT